MSCIDSFLFALYFCCICCFIIIVYFVCLFVDAGALCTGHRPAYLFARWISIILLTWQQSPTVLNCVQSSSHEVAQAPTEQLQAPASSSSAAAYFLADMLYFNACIILC
eukprot:m.229289 g.229289  ORF g.229289 m.229289 type:complete len:109 (-) comp15206_c1_seq9:134-460(-)